MKNILVSTDFSENAQAAVLFAAELARRSEARLILFHAYYPGILLEEVSIWADTDKLEKDVQERMDQLAHSLHSDYGLSVTRLLKPGFAVDEVLAIAEKVDADLVVLGSSGAGKQLNDALGKVAAEILKKIRNPTICVSPETGFKNLTMSDLLSGQAVTGNEAGIKILKRYLPAPPAAATAKEKEAPASIATNLLLNPE
ncbi:MAG TPA: universal stress protein [Adhaeribacter sp.]|nr:universal stress protein [Adhaeribacter sp.]